MNLAEKNNIVRAFVMGPNDGIISVAGIVLGVLAATSHSSNFEYNILISGIAGTIAGMISMAAGEYVSVHSERDAENKASQIENKKNKDQFPKQVDIVKASLQNESIPENLAKKAALEMMKKKPLETTVRVKHGFSIANKINPYHAAIASFFSFPTGALLPMLLVLLVPKDLKILFTYLGVTLALIITGYLAARTTKANTKRGAIRNVIAGLITMTFTYFIGKLFGR